MGATLAEASRVLSASLGHCLMLTVLSVIVAEVRDAAAIVGEEPGRERQAGDRALERLRRRLVTGDPGDDQREQVEVERVALIVRRALRMAAVAVDLPVDFGDQDPAPDLPPSAAAAQFRECSSQLAGMVQSAAPAPAADTPEWEA